MQTALWITAVGAAGLFGAVACLIGLMYLLTAQWLFPQVERRVTRIRRKKRRRDFRRRATDAGSGTAIVPDAVASDLSLTAQKAIDDAERERRRRAVALAVAIACAESGRTTYVPEAPSDWRLLHRARRLGDSLVRRKVRS